METELSFREKRLLEIRPSIDSEIDAALDPAMADFQLNCLRPILKFHNDFFVNLLKKKLFSQHKGWNDLNDQKKRELISSAISQNLEIKKTIEGAIIGLMVDSELEFYFQNEKEIQKRARAFLIERICRSISEKVF